MYAAQFAAALQRELGDFNVAAVKDHGGTLLSSLQQHAP